MKILNMKTRIMLGIYFIYISRKLKSPVASESLLLVCLAAILSLFVSIPSFLSNISNAGSGYHYFLMAFSNTTLMVQMILIAGAVVGIKTAITLTSHLSHRRLA